MHLDRRVAKADRRASPRVPLVCAVRNSFILKSELGKGEMGHDH